MITNPWIDIDIPDPKAINRKRVDHTHPADIYWGKDQQGRYLLICIVNNSIGVDHLPKLKEIEVIFPKDNTLVLALKSEDNWKMFFSLCKDVVNSTKILSTSSNLLATIIRRLSSWQKLLTKDVSNLLNEEKIKGLIGELTFIESHLYSRFGIGNAIKFWMGPEGSPQDFSIKDMVVEVKTQLADSSSEIKINSLDQLCPQVHKMYLYVVTLGKTDTKSSNSIDLYTLINKLRDKILNESPNQLERFNDLLLQLNYIDNEDYIQHSYTFISEKFYMVSEDFPRICSSILPNGISRVGYSVLLSECDKYLTNIDWG